jgi:NADP-dependent 3-hydroxy acid dehydrogenase YdfG
VASYLITGVTRGIGRAVATQLRAGGHEVFGLARTAENLSSVVAELGLAGGCAANLAEPAALAHTLQPLLTGIDRLDGLVHAAGMVRVGTLEQSVPEDFSQQFAVNVTAVAELTRLLLPALRAAGGTVVCVNSGSGLNARSPLGSYGASKFALRAFADALRQEETSLRVSTVYPGRTATQMQRDVRQGEGGAYREEDYLRPETVASVICTVLSLPRDGVITDVTLRPF